MKKGVFFAYVILVAALLVCLNSLSGVSATNIDSCRTLSSPDTYTLTQNVSSSGTCMSITSANVILDCNGYTINFSSSNPGVGGCCFDCHVYCIKKEKLCSLLKIKNI